MIRVLLLAGTGEARRLSHRLVEIPGLELITSLAGITAAEGYAGSVRRRGFGGAEGYRRALTRAGIDAVLDATHPFATRITARAWAEARASGRRFLRLDRPAWTAAPGWRSFDNLADAVAALPAGAVGFVAAGRSAAGLAAPAEARLILRMIEPPAQCSHKVILARPPFALGHERALFADLGVTHLVCKNAGGAAGRAKLDAASALGLPVHMVRRPPPPAGLGPAHIVGSAAAAVVWVQRLAADEDADS
ncbi:MAG: precorrin-6A/cobalt-precorrin-6A reductase [Pseudomonadota bacterium]